MNIHEQLAALTAALLGLTAAMSNGGTAAATTDSKAGAKTGTKTGTKPKGATREEMVTALNEVKEKFGAQDAKDIIKKLGAAKMADVPEAKIDEGFKLAQAKLTAASDDDTAQDDDGL